MSLSHTDTHTHMQIKDTEISQTEFYIVTKSRPENWETQIRRVITRVSLAGNRYQSVIPELSVRLCYIDRQSVFDYSV